jgi:DNA polymerase I-like protein with 3'-5' exonuclease and polymerase domains
MRWQRTPKLGTLSTKSSELRRAQHYPPIAALTEVLTYDRLLSSFDLKLKVAISPATRRVHAHYRVAMADSGRATCSGPNLQQVPRDPRFRALFRAAECHKLVLADYSSMELRAAAYISRDPVMTRALAWISIA